METDTFRSIVSGRRAVASEHGQLSNAESNFEIALEYGNENHLVYLLFIHRFIWAIENRFEA